MTLPIYRLRRWLVVIAVIFTAVVAGMYFYARARQRNVLKEIPNKLGFDIKQTANGFQFSKSDGKRTLFTIQATDLKQFKLNGSAELHNVSIVLYGRDSTRFDQISGDNFIYDKKSGNITASGEVEIGVTDHAQEALGDLVFVEVPDVGRTLTAGSPCAVVESEPVIRIVGVG